MNISVKKNIPTKLFSPLGLMLSPNSGTRLRDKVTEQQCGSVTAARINPMAEIKSYHSLITPTNELPLTMSYHGNIYHEPGTVEGLCYSSK